MTSPDLPFPQGVEDLPDEEIWRCSRSWWFRRWLTAIVLIGFAGFFAPASDEMSRTLTVALLAVGLPKFVHAGSQFLIGGKIRLRRKHFEHRMPCASVAFRWTDMSECELRRTSVLGWTYRQVIVFDVEPRGLTHNELGPVVAIWRSLTGRSMTIEAKFELATEALVERLNAFRERALIEFAPEPGLSDADRRPGP